MKCGVRWAPSRRLNFQRNKLDKESLISKIVIRNYKLLNFLSQVPRKCKTFCQRGHRGWATEDTWKFYGYLSRVIKEGMTHLRDFGCGHPGEIDEDEWRKILNEIIYAFELAEEINEGKRELYISDFTSGQLQKFRCLTLEEFEAMNKGMKLFTEYFFNFWD